MDENVIFDNTQQPQQPQQTTPPPSEPPADGSAPPPLAPPPPPPPGNGMKKKIMIAAIILGILFLVFLIYLFIPKSTQVKNVTLTWWGLWEDERVMQPIIADYVKDHPNVQIKYIKKSPKEYRETLTARIKSESTNAPDIYRYHNTWLPMLLSADIILPLSEDVITPDEFKKNYYPVMQSNLVKNGAIYGIPLEGDTLLLFTNTRLLKDAGMEPPKNWEAFLTTAQKLTQRDPDTQKIKVAGAAMGLYDNVTHASDIVSLLFVQQGVNLDNLNADPEKQYGALRYYVNNFVRKDKNPVWDETLPESKVAFAEGRLAMFFGYSWDAFDIQELNQNLAFEIHPVPANYQREISIASYWVEGVSAKSPNKKEALEFMHYLAQKETSQRFFTEASKVRDFGEPYARVDLAETLKDNPMAYPVVTQLKTAKSTIFSSLTWDGETGLNSRANVYLGNAVKNILVDPASEDTEVEKLNSGVAQILEEYGVQQQ